jgi:hypothetical protein
VTAPRSPTAIASSEDVEVIVVVKVSATGVAEAETPHAVVAINVVTTPATTRRTTVDHEPRTIFMEVEIIATDISVNNLKKYSEFVQTQKWLVI